jgi:hypothetical protein
MSLHALIIAAAARENPPERTGVPAWVRTLGRTPLENRLYRRAKIVVGFPASEIPFLIPHSRRRNLVPQLNPLLALGVLVSTAATDAVYVLFNAAVSSRRRLPAATWSSIWYLLSAFAVISYTKDWVYVCFAALGSWIGAYLSITFLGRSKGISGTQVS